MNCISVILVIKYESPYPGAGATETGVLGGKKNQFLLTKD